MYELIKWKGIFTSKFVGTGPKSYEKKNLPGRCLTKVEKRWCIRKVRKFELLFCAVILTPILQCDLSWAFHVH